MAAGAARTKLFGWAVPVASVSTLRWSMLGLALLFELSIGAAAAPYIFTPSGRSAATQSFRTTWHVCEVFLGTAH